MPQRPEIPDTDTLRTRAAQLIATGRLPPGAPARSWGGPGSGEPCALCEVPIDRGELEFELEFPAGDGGPLNVCTCRFHTRCFDVWLQARKDAEPR